MKRNQVLSIIIAAIVVLVLAVCVWGVINHQSTQPVKEISKHQVKNTSRASEKASSSKSSISSEMMSNSSSVSESAPVAEFDLNEARIALYKAGVDSSQIDDETLQQYWESAQNQGVDFGDYVSSQLK